MPESKLDDQSNQSTSSARQREVRYEHSADLADLLSRLEASLVISTYQAGKLAVLGSHDRSLTLSFHNLDRPMGVAVDDACNTMAVAARNKVWFLRNARDVAARLEPAGHRSCFLTRSAGVTGEIQAHELGWVGDELWIVNTLFSCLCTLHPDYSFAPRWKPPFVTALAPEDRCHLNGLAIADGRPRYVTAMAETDAAGRWRENKVETGVLIDVDSGETVARGFAMPHSPRVHLGHVWLLDSGRGALVRVDPGKGETETVARFPGYARGLALIGRVALVGLSRIRETSAFDGVPIAENRDRLKCGVGIVDLMSGELVGQFEFTAGVDEIFDVALVPHSPLTALRGPHAEEDGSRTIWTVPADAEQIRT